MINIYIKNLIKTLSYIPFLSEQNANRIALSLINRNKITGVLNILNSIKDKIRKCICGNIDELINNECSLCYKKSPDTILIVFSLEDLITIENSGIYAGQYHIIFKDESNLLQDLNIEDLITRIQKKQTQEVILALSHKPITGIVQKMIIKSLKDYNIKITQIQAGIPVGGNITHENESTLKAALLSRYELK